MRLSKSTYTISTNKSKRIQSITMLLSQVMFKRLQTHRIRSKLAFNMYHAIHFFYLNLNQVLANVKTLPPIQKTFQSLKRSMKKLDIRLHNTSLYYTSITLNIIIVFCMDMYRNSYTLLSFVAANNSPFCIALLTIKLILLSLELIPRL